MNKIMALIEGLKEPQLGDREKQEQADVEYNKPLNKPLKETQDDLKDLFGSFQNPEDKIYDIKTPTESEYIAANYPDMGKFDKGIISEEKPTIQDEATVEGGNDFGASGDVSDVVSSSGIETIENETVQDQKIDENPSSPLIDSLVSQGYFDGKEEAIPLIKEALIKGDDITTNIRAIEGLDDYTKEQVIESIVYINEGKGKEQSISKFNNDFSTKIDDIKETVDGGKGEKVLSENNADLMEKIGGNYFNIGHENGNTESNTDALDKAFKITLNGIIKDGGKTFKRPDEFDNMKAVVNDTNGDFKDRFDMLSKINTLQNDDKAKGNKKLDNSFKKGVENKDNKEKTLEGKFTDFQIVVKQSIENKDYKELQKLLEQSKVLKEEVDSEGDIFVSSDFEKLTKEINDTLSENA